MHVEKCQAESRLHLQQFVQKAKPTRKRELVQSEKLCTTSNTIAPKMRRQNACQNCTVKICAMHVGKFQAKRRLHLQQFVQKANPRKQRIVRNQAEQNIAKQRSKGLCDARCKLSENHGGSFETCSFLFRRCGEHLFTLYNTKNNVVNSEKSKTFSNSNTVQNIAEKKLKDGKFIVLK